MAFKHRDYTQGEDVGKWKDRADSYGEYNPSDNVNQYYQQYQDWYNNRPGDWTGGQYGSALQDLLNQINNRKEFSYDLNGDMLYRQYRDQYARQGKMAMMDTLAQAANLTGGYGNSYAVTAGNQAYQGYLQGLNDKVPELYQLALNKYNAEGEDLYNRFGLTNQMYQNEYGEWRDQIGDWNNELDRLYGQYTDERGFDYNKWANDRDYDYNRYQDERNWDYQMWADDYDRAWAEYQYNHRGGSGGRGGNGGGGAFQGNAKTESFINSQDVMGKNEFGYHQGNFDGKQYGSYQDYLKEKGVYAKLKAAYESGSLNQEELEFLLSWYGF